MAGRSPGRGRRGARRGAGSPAAPPGPPPGWARAARPSSPLGGGAVAGMAVLVAPAVARGDLSAPSAALLVLLPLALAEVAGPLADAGALAARTRAAAARLDELTTRDPAVRDPRTPVPFHGDDPADLAVSRVGAAWADRLVLDDLSLSVAAGRRIGVVGPSGSGKCTLAALLLRFVDPVHGVVEQAGVPLRRRALDDVRRRTGLVDDDPHVFATLAGRERPARPAGGQRRRGRGRAAARVPGRLAGRAAGRAGHAARGGRCRGLGGRARADRRGPLAAGRPAGAGARRAHGPPRPRDGRAARGGGPRRRRSAGRSCGSPTSRSVWTAWTGSST